MSSLKTVSPRPRHDGTFATALIRWQKRLGRHDLPWQNTRDSYRIWLSEVMLQQTQVGTVIPYYLRFLERFPNVQALAAAPTTEVMALWSGLGYYSRARNLHRCAQTVVSEYGSQFPSDPTTLATLPGIGRSTAAAIAVFAFGANSAILDGNVKRVLARAFGIEGFPGERLVEQRLWTLAESLLPNRNVEAYTQGLMDFGATVCTRSRPKCDACPMAAQCVALATDRVVQLPTRKPKVAVPERRTTMLVILYRDQVLLEQRPDFGIWGGLLSLPEVNSVPDAANPEQVAQAALSFGEIGSIAPLAPFTHGFTHFKLHVAPYRVELKRRAPMAAQGEHAWHRLDHLEQLGLPAPVKKLLQQVVPGGKHS